MLMSLVINETKDTFTLEDLVLRRRNQIHWGLKGLDHLLFKSLVEVRTDFGFRGKTSDVFGDEVFRYTHERETSEYNYYYSILL